MKPVKLINCLICAVVALTATAQTNIRFGNEKVDTARIDALLVEAVAQDFRSAEAAVAFFARSLEGTPYAAATLEGEPEMLTVRIDSVDCTTFVETAMALAFTNSERRSSWRDFVYNLRRLRYRNGEVEGYASRLHYVCDWAVDNIHRGNIKDATLLFPNYSYVVRSIDFMSTNRDKYEALADSVNYERIRGIENGYRHHRFPYIKSNSVKSKDAKAAFRSGDVVALVSRLENLDTSHMGIVLKDDKGNPYLLHASSTSGKVEVSKYDLAEFLRRNRQWIGVRVFRLAE